MKTVKFVQGFQKTAAHLPTSTEQLHQWLKAKHPGFSRLGLLKLLKRRLKNG